MDFHCHKCRLTLGGMEKGKIRNGTIMLCSKCWTKASAAIDMAELVASQGNDMFGKGKNPMDGDDTVDHLMNPFGMKGKKR